MLSGYLMLYYFTNCFKTKSKKLLVGRSTEIYKKYSWLKLNLVAGVFGLND